jgi:hypothetical protein
LSVHPDVTDEVISTRLTGRMARQKGIFARDVPMLFLIDQLSLYRLIGSPEIMAAQPDHLVTVAGRPRVTIQVVPAIAVPSVAHGIVLTENAAYSESAINGSDQVLVRDTADRDGVTLTIPAETWRAFTDSLR